MTCAARLAEKLKLADEQLLQRQSKLLLDVGLPIDAPQDRVDELILAMKRDKKVAAGKLNLILADRIGNVELMAAPDDETIRMAF
jgi:3-dehydroquinate synthase